MWSVESARKHRRMPHILDFSATNFIYIVLRFTLKHTVESGEIIVLILYCCKRFEKNENNVSRQQIIVQISQIVNRFLKLIE